MELRYSMKHMIELGLDTFGDITDGADGKAAACGSKSSAT
jgi:hypothetical protein